LVYYARQNFETAIEILPKAIELAENKFLQRARQVEIYAEAPTLLGPEPIPVLRGRFAAPDNKDSTIYVAEFKPISYRSDLASFDSEEFSCVTSVVDAIQNQSTLPGLDQSLEFTQAFSQTTGSATLNLINGSLLLDLDDMPQPETTPYELKVRFWPNRTDSVGYLQPDASNKVQASIQFEEKLPAPIEYYYTLGLAFTYLDLCQEAKPWLLTSLEIDSSAYNPAWHGIRRCAITDTPPTPLPTFTPIPEQNQ
jgi:tetratricopeptide (TPR) repeat protein